MTKTYLGDSVYAEDVGGPMIKLTTENGMPAPSNVIFLEPEVWAELVRWVTEVKPYE